MHSSSKPDNAVSEFTLGVDRAVLEELLSAARDEFKDQDHPTPDDPKLCALILESGIIQEAIADEHNRLGREGDSAAWRADNLLRCLWKCGWDLRANLASKDLQQILKTRLVQRRNTLA